MSAELDSFVDTNILVYAVSRSEEGKHDIALAIVKRGFEEGCYTISTQVLLEFYVTVTRKLKTPLSPADALAFATALSQWRVVGHSPELVLSALATAQRFQISTWDAAILEAARQARCSQVLSEDLSHGTSYDGVLVTNPLLTR